MKKKIVFKYLYLVIVVFFLLSPFIINYGIFLYPKKVIGNIKIEKNGAITNVSAVFVDNGMEYELELNKDYIDYKQIELIYNSQNPNEVIPFSFAGILGLYTKYKMAIIVFLFFIISALYFTIKDTSIIEPDDNYTN